MTLPFGVPQCLRDDEWAVLRELAYTAAVNDVYKRGSKKHDALDRALAALVQIVRDNEFRSQQEQASNDN